jgi:hypothetical protein
MLMLHPLIYLNAVHVIVNHIQAFSIFIALETA